MGVQFTSSLTKIVSVSTIAEMKSLSNYTNGHAIIVQEKYTGGKFYYDASDLTTSEDGGTVFVDVSGRRFKRIIHDDIFDIGWFAGDPYNFVGQVPDNTTAIQNCVNAAIRYRSINGVKPMIRFPGGFYFITATIDFTKHPDTGALIDGWTVFGQQSMSLVSIPTGHTITGPMFNFNFNSSSISRYNTVKGIYFYSDASSGRTNQVIDFSYNNRFGLYDVRTSRVSNQADIIINFCYEGLIEKCSLSGGKTISVPSDGVQMNNQANAVMFIQTSIDNYIGNGSTITGSGIYFGQSKSVMISECTIQQCDYGITLATGAWAPKIKGGYFEGNAKADIRIGTGGGSVYSVNIDTPSLRSQNGVNVNGLLIDGANIFGMICSTVSFENDDAIGFKPVNSQKIQDIVFNNCRTGGTVFSYRNLINTGTQVYMDNIHVWAPGTAMNGGDVKSFIPIICEPYREYCTDFNTWTNSDNTAITYLAANGTWLGSTAWMKNDANVHTMMFILADTNGLQNQVITFSLWVKFNGTINGNDLIWMENQSGSLLSCQRTLRPSSSTIGFVKIYCYGLIGSGDTSVKIKILTRDNNIYYAQPSLKLGFV